MHNKTESLVNSTISVIEMIRATPVTAFVAGNVTSASMLAIHHINPNELFDRLIVGFLIVFIVAIFFLFVVNDEKYGFKFWYGFKDFSVSQFLRGLSWLVGMFIVLLVASVK